MQRISYGLYHIVETSEFHFVKAILPGGFSPSQYLSNKASTTESNDSFELFNRFEVRHHHGNNFHYTTLRTLASLMVWFHSPSLWKPCQGLHRERWRGIEIALPVVKQNCRIYSTSLGAEFMPRSLHWVGWADKGNSILSASSTETDGRLSRTPNKTQRVDRQNGNARNNPLHYSLFCDADDGGSGEKSYTSFIHFIY